MPDPDPGTFTSDRNVKNHIPPVDWGSLCIHIRDNISILMFNFFSFECALLDIHF